MRQILIVVFLVLLCVPLLEQTCFADEFYKTRKAAISGHNRKTLHDVEPEQCMRACEREKSFVCKSFDYNHIVASCDLSDKSASEVGGLKRDYEDDPYDHYARARFNHIKNAAISGHNKKQIRNVTPEQCRAACLRERSFKCRSFDYNKPERWCDLSDATHKSAGGLKRDYEGNKYDHYHRNW